jgi:thiol:disulfide interchange protein DsbA
VLKNMLRSIPWLLLSFSLLLIPPLAVAVDPPFTEGVNYKLIDPPLPTPQTNKVEVVEMFWYGCPHCYHFEPLLEKWVKGKSDQVTFIRIPAIFRDSWLLDAQAFYTAKALGVLEKIHRPLFDAIHLEKRHLNTKEALADFFATQGVAKEDFLSTFDSFAVQGKVQQAVVITRASSITGVPAMIVNGKYRTDAELAGSFERMLEVVDYLIAQKNASAQAINSK